MMAQIVYFKEWLIVFYKKHVDVVLPVLKLVFAFYYVYVSGNVSL